MKKRILIAFLTLSLSTFAVLRLSAEGKAAKPSKEKPHATGKQNASQLIDDAERALAFTVKSARAAGKELEASNPAAKPFLQSLKTISKSLDDAKKSLAAKDKNFFKAINAAKSGVAEMHVTWDLTRSKNAGVISGAKKLSGAVTALQENYNPMVQRKAKGGELTDAEKATFKKMKAQQVDLEKKVKALEAKAKGDPALKAGLKEINHKSREIAKAPETVNAYVDAMDLLATINGLIGGYTYYLEPAERAEWATVETYSDSWDSYYTYESYEYNWNETTVGVDVYDSYDVEISSEEMTSEESYIEESSFEMTEEETDEVAEESSEISEDEAGDDEMESEQEEESDDEDDAEMDDDSSDDNDSDDDGGSDDGGGDDGE